MEDEDREDRLEIPDENASTLSLTALATVRKAFPRLGTVLVVEDAADIRRILRMMLESASYAVSEAPDGPSALQALRREKADLVLLDVMMPGMNGDEVLRILRETFSPAALPVIVVTALGEVEDIRALIQLGAQDYLVKPIQLGHLLGKVDRALRIDRRALLHIARKPQGGPGPL